jgi:DNA-binding transcriptional regulator YiaG
MERPLTPSVREDLITWAKHRVERSIALRRQAEKVREEANERVVRARDRLEALRSAGRCRDSHEGRDGKAEGGSKSRTIQELREARGESRDDLAAAVRVTLSELTEWERGRAQPGVARMRLLTEHFDVRDDQINLRPRDPPSLGDRLADLF